MSTAYAQRRPLFSIFPYLRKRMQDLQDLGLFGFFVALGRSTRAFLASRGVGDSEESLASLLRYLTLYLLLSWTTCKSVAKFLFFWFLEYVRVSLKLRGD